jgi:putative membrane protein
VFSKFGGWLSVAARGFLLGVACLVPGLSSGTLALVTGLYERLISALRHLHWTFLFTLALGGALAVLTLSHPIHFLLTHQPHASYLLATFTGFVLGSAYLLARRIEGWRAPHFPWLALGAVAGFALSGAASFHLPLFVAGIIAATALLLPGISGAYLLGAMGHYDAFIENLAHRQMTPLAILASGILVGLLLSAHLIGFLLSRFRNATFATLIGLMLGGLRITSPLLPLLVAFCVVLLMERLAYARA